MNTPLLEVKNLKKIFQSGRVNLFKKAGSVHAINDVSFHIFPGETLGLVGESGCGKSTVGKTILHLHQADKGDVIFDGKMLSSLSKHELRKMRREIQMIFQDPSDSLNARHTISTILEEPFIIHGIGSKEERRDRIEELILKVGLNLDALDKYPHEFSGGQKQRIGIARAIALKPKLIVCDEPVSALDVSVQSQIINLLMTLQKEMGLALLFISHDLSVVKHVSDRIAVMYLGNIVEYASSDNLYKMPKHPYSKALLDAVPIPDPSLEIKPLQLSGELPSPLNPPSGCSLHTRCPYARPNCQQDVPLLIETASPDSSHQVACHYVDQLE